MFETLGKLKIIAMDKTGTLTVGMPQVTDELAFTGNDDARDILRLAAALERESSHPIAIAIMNHARKRDPALAAQALPGSGVAGHVEGRDLLLVSPRQVADGVTEQPQHHHAIETLESEGKSVAILVEGERLLGVIAVRDEPCDDARAGLRALAAGTRRCSGNGSRASRS